MRGTFAALDELTCMGYLLRRELRLAAQLHASPFRCLPARLCPFVYQRPFKFRKDTDHLPHGATWRCFSVDCFCQGLELDPLPFQIIQQGYQIPQRAAPTLHSGQKAQHTAAARRSLAISPAPLRPYLACYRVPGAPFLPGRRLASIAATLNNVTELTRNTI